MKNELQRIRNEFVCYLFLFVTHSGAPRYFQGSFLPHTYLLMVYFDSEESAR